jgi:predicted DNA-binding antitoxin AbrB/MazE fold protein
MSYRVHAIYDGEVLWPESPVDLKPNTRYLLVVEKEETNGEISEETPYPLSIIRSFATDMKVTDLSSRRDYYGHGRKQ